MSNPVPAPPSGGKKGLFALVALVGAPAAALLLTLVPLEESGRTVAVTITPEGGAVVRHVAGPQYLKSYLDLAGVPTACDGIADKRIKLGQSYTEAQCAVMLEEALVTHAEGALRCSSGLRAHAKGPLRAATISFTYNVGVGGWCGSTARRRIDAGDLRGGCDALLAWNKARVRGQLVPVRGLTARRQRERALCLKEL